MAFYGLAPISFESVSQVTATNTVELGTLRIEAGEVYEYVYAGKDLNQGFVGVYSGTSGKTLVATGAVSGEMAGGAVKHATIPSGSYGWVLKKGVVDLCNGRASTAPSVDQVVRLAADGKICCDVMVVTSAIEGGHIFGKVLSAGASGGTGSSKALCYVSIY